MSEYAIYILRSNGGMLYNGHYIIFIIINSFNSTVFVYMNFELPLLHAHGVIKLNHLYTSNSNLPV